MAAATAVDERLMALQESILGSSVEASAGAYLGNYVLDAPVKACMTELGLPYQISYIDTEVGTEPNSLGDTWTEPLSDDNIIVNLQVAAEKSEVEERLMAPLPEDAIELTPEYGRALAQCEEQSSGDPERKMTPPGAIELATALDIRLSEIESQIGSQGPYNRCMADAGLDVTRAGFDGVDGLNRLLENEAPPTNKIPEPGEVGDAEWEAYESFAASALESDRECRVTEHIEAMSLVTGMLDEFEAANGDQIAEIRSDWEAIVQEALSKGWVDRSQRYDVVESTDLSATD